MARFMRLLMITRKVDWQDASPAGFTYNWVKKIGQKLEKLYVITWQKSNRGDLPENIEIISLPKNKLIKMLVIQGKLLKILPKINGVFCHQNPEYTILSALWVKLFRKKIVTWYAHGLKNRKKIEVVGQGIDVDYFKKHEAGDKNKEKFKIVSIGRISPAKDYETLIEAVNDIKNIDVQIIGAPALKKDHKYFENLKQLVRDKKLENYIKFLGPVSHSQISPYYQGCDLFINLGQTGSMDKAVLEAMACEKLVLTCNEAFIDFLDDQRLIFQKKNPQDLAQKIINLINLSLEERETIGRQSRDKIVKNHNLDNLVSRIINQYEKEQV